MSQQSTSCWIRRCYRQYIFCTIQPAVYSSQPLSSAKWKIPLSNSFASTMCDRRELSLFTASAAAGPEPWGADDRPNSLEKKDKRERSFSQRKRLTMNTLHSLENRARVLFAQRISRVCHLASEMLTRIGTPPKAFHNTHTSETKFPEDKKRMMCSTGALLCPQTLISLCHRCPPANVKCIGCL